MKINCRHGFFTFEEVRVGQISDFASLFNLSIVRADKWFTFEGLKDAPDYALEGGLYLNAPITKTYEGEPWEIMKANSLVYNFALGLMVPIASVSNPVEIGVAANYLVSAGLILPGSMTSDGKRVSGYSGWFQVETTRFRYTEVTYV